MTNSAVTFPPLEEQLDLITKGAAEIIPLEALKERDRLLRVCRCG
jgi:tyrosyl-tRNA synthetase